MKILKYILLVLLLFTKGIIGFGQSYTSIASGAWNDPGIWTLPWNGAPIPPQNNQPVVINAGHTITGATGSSFKLNVAGTLTFSGDYNDGGVGITIADGGTLIVQGNLAINGDITINGTGKMKVLGSITQTGGLVKINDSGILVVGQNYIQDWQTANVNGTSTLLVVGNYLVSGNLAVSSSASVYVNGTAGSGCTSCGAILTSHPAWIFYTGGTSIPSWWTDHLANANSSSSSGSVCAGGSKSFSVSAVTVGVGNLSANQFEWAAYGGTISGASNTATIGGHTASVKTITGVDSNNKSSVTISWEGTAFSGAYVAVRQIPQDGCSDGKWSVLNVGFMSNASISLITGTSPLCVGETAPFTADAELAGGTGEWSSSDTNVASVNALSGLVTAVGYGTCNIIYTITGGCGGTQTKKQSLTVISPVGDPAVFGSNIWNVYAYQGNNVNLSGITYKGYYTEPNFSFSTADRWGINGSPDEATGYQGCEVTGDNHTFVYKREGFTSGTYQIAVGHDDGYQLYIDGVLIGSAGGWDNRNPEVLTTFYTLNGTSKIEFRVAENGGESRGALTFTEVCTNPTDGGAITGAQTICYNGDPVAFTSSSDASGETGTLEYKWQYSTIDSPYSWQETGATGLTYDDNTALTADRWYHRLARVDCKTDWTGAAESNVLKVTVTAVPTATISYSGSPFCTSVSTPQPVTISGTGAYTGGTYASTSGLTIDTSTGAITPGTSTAGTYMVTYTVAASGGCSVVTATTNVTIGDTTPPLITNCLSSGEATCVKDIPPAITTIQEFIRATGPVTDNCTATNDLILLHNDVIIPGLSCEVRRVYTITDASGNTASCTQLFSITDKQAPVINSVTDLVVSPNTNSCGANLIINVPTDVTENCGFVVAGAHFEYTIAGTPKTGDGTISDTFPEGITLITWTITDLCGHVSLPKTQKVQVVFNRTPISYDNNSTATSVGSGVQPMQTSTHEYFVDDKRPEDGYTYAWGLYVDNNGVPGAAVDGSTYSLTTVNQADVQIMFKKNTNSSPIGNYLISVIKTKTETTCKNQTTLPITVQSNSSFDVSIGSPGDQCQAPGLNATTTIRWNVIFPAVSTEPFMFNYEIKKDGTAISSGAVSNISYSTAIPLTPTSSGTLPYSQYSKNANSLTVIVQYTFYSETGLAGNHALVLSITGVTDAYQVSEPNITNNTDELQTYGVINTSAITTD